MTTLVEYDRDNSNIFTVEVNLPNKRISPQMTTKSCQFLSSWTNCFTATFTKCQSWNGQFTLEHFNYIDGHIRNIRWTKTNCPTGSMVNNLIKFVNHVKHILCSNRTSLISKYSSYLKQFIVFANCLMLSLNVTNILTS